MTESNVRSAFATTPRRQSLPGRSGSAVASVLPVLTAAALLWTAGRFQMNMHLPLIASDTPGTGQLAATARCERPWCWQMANLPDFLPLTAVLNGLFAKLANCAAGR
jgi:hypothetical protein